jgi:GNAT superfamily N-acetyltransferase
MDIVIGEIEEKDYPEVTALLNDHVVGLISTVTMFWASSELANTIFVQAFVVKNEYQNKGIGTKLLKYTEDYARVNGIIGVGLQSGAQRTAAHAFYEHNGYAKSHYFYKNFNPM